MAKHLKPVFDTLIGSFTLLPLAYVLNFFTFVTNLNKAKQNKCTMLGRMVVSILDFVVWALYLFVKHLSNRILSPKVDNGSGAVCNARLAADGAMSRALRQMLVLVNDTPASSEKYEFVRTLTEKLITQNMSKGDGTFWETNRVALQSAFLRTSDLLAISLEELQHQEEMKEASWFWVLVHSILQKNLGTFHWTLSVDYFCTLVHNFLFGAAKSSKLSSDLHPSQSTSISKRLNFSVTAEKLAQELLWITEKLKECSSLHGITRRWSAMPRLANLSCSAHPRVQACLLRVSVMLLKDFAVCESESSCVKVDLLLIWLPLFCHAKIGFDFPSLTRSEKADTLSDLEQSITTLPVLDQEVVLSCWLREYVSSASEWPNLQECFEKWCSYVRSSI